MFRILLEGGAAEAGRLERLAVAGAGRRLDALWVAGGEAPRRLVRLGLAGSVVVALAAGLAWHPVAGLVLGVLAASLPSAVLSVLAARRREAFRAQLPDAFEAAAGSLRAGLSLEQALHALAAQAAAPLSQELGLALRQAELGATLEEALRQLLDRMPSEDLRLAVETVALARETGGNLADVLAELAGTLRRRREIRGRLRSLTAQGRMQGMVLAAVPAGIAAALYAMDPDMMRRFLGRPSGWALLGAAIVLELAGVLWIRRIAGADPRI